MNQVKKKKLRLNILSFSFLLLFILLTLGALFQAVMAYFEQRAFPPPGNLFNMGGYQLYMNCTGTGDVTILLESDLQFPSSVWDSVQNQLQPHTQVCSYDRAGLGWSEDSPLPRKGQEIVEELFRLLRKAYIENPILAVGNGNGSLITRLFANRYPENVIGMILVSPDLGVNHDSPKLNSTKVFDYLYLQYQIARIATWFGVVRLNGYTGILPDHIKPYTKLPRNIQRKIFALTIYKPNYWIAAYEDSSSLSDLQNEVQINNDLNNIPLVILINSNSSELTDPETNPELLKLTKLSSRSDLEFCSDCGNILPLSNPEKVASTILNLYDQVHP